MNHSLTVRKMNDSGLAIDICLAIARQRYHFLSQGFGLVSQNWEEGWDNCSDDLLPEWAELFTSGLVPCLEIGGQLFEIDIISEEVRSLTLTEDEEILESPFHVWEMVTAVGTIRIYSTCEYLGRLMLCNYTPNYFDCEGLLRPAITQKVWYESYIEDCEQGALEDYFSRFEEDGDKSLCGSLDIRYAVIAADKFGISIDDSGFCEPFTEAKVCCLELDTYRMGKVVQSHNNSYEELQADAIRTIAACVSSYAIVREIYEATIIREFRVESSEVFYAWQSAVGANHLPTGQYGSIYEAEQAYVRKHKLWNEQLVKDGKEPIDNRSFFIWAVVPKEDYQVRLHLTSTDRGGRKHMKHYKVQLDTGARIYQTETNWLHHGIGRLFRQAKKTEPSFAGGMLYAKYVRFGWNYEAHLLVPAPKRGDVWLWTQNLHSQMFDV